MTRHRISQDYKDAAFRAFELQGHALPHRLYNIRQQGHDLYIEDKDGNSFKAIQHLPGFEDPDSFTFENENQQKQSESDDLFGEVISAYTRRQALEDGQQIDANTGDLAEVTRQHFKWPCFITSSLFSIIEKATKNPRHGSDLKGIWHDICWMGKNAMRQSSDPGSVSYKVIIKGAGRKSTYDVVIQSGPLDIDNPEPALTFMLPEDR
jgi:hypothetical protein